MIMDVAAYIREYLYKQDFLDIPGLGTFFLTREPFSIEGQKQSIRPGTKALIFRENSVINNDTLSYFIARRQSITVDEARQAIREFVGQIRELFLTRGALDFPQLGKFSASDGFHLQFTSANLNFSPSSFGLGSVSLSSFAPVQDNQHSESPLSTTAEKPLHENPTYDSPTEVNAPSVSPTYLAPTYEAPKYEAPTFETSTYQAPTYQAPTYEAPTYDTPAEVNAPSVTPTYQAPTYEAPTYDTPAEVNASPVTPSYQAPTYDAPASRHDDVSTNSSLPTAEDLYRMYGFKKEENEHPEIVKSSESNHPAPPTESNTPASPENQASVYNPLETPAGSDLLYNPLAWPSSPETNANYGANSGLTNSHEEIPETSPDSSFASPANNFSTAENEPHSTVEPAHYEEQHAFPKPEAEVRNNSIYWIMGTLLLVGMIAFFVFLQKDAILKQIHSHDGFEKLQEESKISKKDSLLATQRAAEQTQALNKISLDSDKKVSGLALDANGKIPDTATVKPLEEAGNFLLVEQSQIHLKQTALKKTRDLAAKQINSEVVVSKHPLFPFFVVVGEYEDRASATTARDSLQKTGIETRIMKNKTKKDVSQ